MYVCITFFNGSEQVTKQERILLKIRAENEKKIFIVNLLHRETKCISINK